MGHYLKANHGTESPANYLFWHLSAIPLPVDGLPDAIRWEWHRGAAITLRMEKGEITRRKVHDLPTPNDLWDLVSASLDKRRPLYMVGYALAHSWRLSGGWEWLEQQQPATWRIVIANPPIMFRGKIGGKTIAVMDAYNWFPLDLETLGRSVGITRHPGASHHANISDHYLASRTDCQIIESAFAGLVQWWRRNDLGVLGKTVAGCAINSYRHRFMLRSILHHDNEQCYSLERNCYYGGEVAIARTGKIPGMVWHLDVASLYPAMMAKYTYPCRLVKWTEQGSVDWLRPMLRDYIGAASVWLRAVSRQYPLRHDGRTIYPDGCYRTFLCGAELQDAIDRDEVVAVNQCAVYEHGDLFSSFVSFYWNERQRAKKAGKTHEELIVKMILNSLYGKFAQRPALWVTQEQILPPDLWCQWRMRDDIAGKEREFRSLAGQVQELVCEGEPWNTCPIIAACVTAHGRQFMRSLREIAGIGNWYYQDTDSLMVSDAGMGNLLLAGMIAKNHLGKLKVESIFYNLTIHAPKWYEFDGETKHAGVRLGADPLPNGRVGQWRFDNMMDGIRRHADPSIYMIYQRGPMHCMEIDGIVDADGFVKPQTITTAFDDIDAATNPNYGRLVKHKYWEMMERQGEAGGIVAGGATE